MSKRITELRELASLSVDDIFVVVDDPNQAEGETKYIKASTILEFLNGPNINPNNYNTTINLSDSIIKSSNGVNFVSNINNSISFNSEYPSGTTETMQININDVEQGLITFYSIYLESPIIIFIDGIIYSTIFSIGVKNL